MKKISFVLWGAVFGFLLSRAGATTFDYYAGLFLFRDLQLLWVICCAVAVGIAGIALLKRLGVASAYERKKLSGQAAAHRVSVDVSFLNLQVIHQLDHVLGSSCSSRLRLIAFTVISIIDSDDTVGFRKSRCDTCSEPHPLRRIRVSMNQHNPRAGITGSEVMDLYSI